MLLFSMDFNGFLDTDVFIIHPPSFIDPQSPNHTHKLKHFFIVYIKEKDHIYIYIYIYVNM